MLNQSIHKALFALDSENKERYICEDKDILKTINLFCPLCKESVICIKGDIRQHHFRHKNDVEIRKYGETEIHKYAKKCLKYFLETSKIQIKTNSEIHVIDLLHCKIKIQEEYLDKNNNCKWDIACLNDENEVSVAFEVKHTHKADETNRTGDWYEIEAIEIINLEDCENITLHCVRKNKTFSNKESKDLNKDTKACVIIEQRNAGAGKTDALSDEAKCKQAKPEYDILISLFPQHSQKDEFKFKLQHKTNEKNYLYCEEKGFRDSDDNICLELKNADLCSSRQSVFEGYSDGVMRFVGTVHSFICAIYRLTPNFKNGLKFDEMAFDIIQSKDFLREYFKSKKTIRYSENSININSKIYIVCDEILRLSEILLQSQEISGYSITYFNVILGFFERFKIFKTDFFISKVLRFFCK